MSIEYMTHVWRDKTLKRPQLLAMLAIADYANDSGICWPSVPTLASRVRCSERGIQKIISNLELGGYISVARCTGPAGCNTYQILKYRGGEKSSPGEPQFTTPVNPSSPPPVNPSSPKPSYRTINEPPIVGASRIDLELGIKIPEQDPLAIPSELSTPETKTAWNDWLAYRKSRRKPVSQIAAKRAYDCLREWGAAVWIESIESSIRNDYQGIYKPKTQSSPSGSSQFWENTKAFEQVQAELKTLENSISKDAMGTMLFSSVEQKERLVRLRNRKKELKAKLNLL